MLLRRQFSLLAKEPVLKLYQYAICPYCCKVKGVLDYYQIPYETVEVNPLTKEELKAADFRQKKVPFAVFSDGSKIGDSSVIIQHLVDRKLVPDDGGVSGKSLALLNRMSILMFPNITRNFLASWQAFSYVQRVSTFTLWQKTYNHVLGAVAMVFANGRLKLKHGIVDERQELLDAANTFVKQVLVGAKEATDGAPNKELLSAQMFGTVKAIEGLDTHTWLLEEALPEFREWYANMTNIQSVGEGVCSSQEQVPNPVNERTMMSGP